MREVWFRTEVQTDARSDWPTVLGWNFAVAGMAEEVRQRAHFAGRALGAAEEREAAVGWLCSLDGPVRVYGDAADALERGAHRRPR